MKENKKQSVLNGALILSAAVIIVKIIGAFYKMPLTTLIGGVGRGYFNSAYEIYTPLYAISVSGLPIAVSKMVSENVALHRYREAKATFDTALRMFFFIGFAGVVLLPLIALPYVKFVAGMDNLPSILMIVPALFFCSITSVYRGFYNGLSNMKPTAVSQVIEALIKLVIGLGAAYLIVQLGLKQFHDAQLSGGPIVVFGKSVSDLAEAYSAIYPYSAAGAIFGVTSGTMGGMIYLILKHKFRGETFTTEQLESSPEASSSRTISKRLVTIAFPIIIASLVLSITNIIDTVTIQTRLGYAVTANPELIQKMYSSSFEQADTLEKDIVKYLWGVYGSGVDFKNLIPSLISSLGISSIPALAAAWAVRDDKKIRNTISSVLRITMIVSLPAGIGIGVLAKPILSVVYSSRPDIIPIAAPIVAMFGYSTALVSVSAPITNMLQAIGRADIPLKSLVLGAAVKTVSNYILVGNPEYNIKGAPIGNILCYIAIVAINLFYLLKVTRSKIDISTAIVKPFLSSALCGISAWAVYAGACRFLNRGETVYIAISLALSIAAGGFAYAVSILLLRGIVEDDVISLPKGAKIAGVLKRFNLLG